MLINNILTILLSLFLTLENTTNKILIKDTLIIETLTLSKEELIAVLERYVIAERIKNIKDEAKKESLQEMIDASQEESDE